MRSFLRFFLKPFVKYAYSDVRFIAESAIVGQSQYDPAQMVIVLKSQIGESIMYFDGDDAREFKQGIEEAAYYASEGMYSPNYEDE